MGYFRRNYEKSGGNGMGSGVRESGEPLGFPATAPVTVGDSDSDTVRVRSFVSGASSGQDTVRLRPAR